MTDDAPQPTPDPARAKLGLALAALGILGIVWGVLFVAESARGDQPLYPTFAERRSYDQVKTSVHESLPGGLMRSLAGLIVTIWGARLYQRHRRPPGDPLEEMQRRQRER